MYFKNIFNIETEKIARLKKVERVDYLSELDKRYWTIEKHDEDNLIRAFPRFNMDNLSSDNKDDVIINPEVLMAHNLMNTIISCDSDNTPSWNEDELTVKLYTLIENYDKYYLTQMPSIQLNAIVVDNQNNLVPNISLDFYISWNNEEKIIPLGEAVTNKNGLCSVEYTPKDISEDSIKCTAWVQFKNNEIKLSEIYFEIFQ